MKRKYHEWSAEELERIREYIKNTRYPTSLYNLADLASIMRVSKDSVRGAVLRKMSRMQNDVCDE